MSALSMLPLAAKGLHVHGAAIAGETWNFQCWFRDKNPGVTSNFTDGIEIVFMEALRVVVEP